MIVKLEAKDSVVAYLEENVNGHSGLDLYVFDRSALLNDSSPLPVHHKLARPQEPARPSRGLEARLVYSPHTENEQGRRLVEQLMHDLTGKEFSTRDYLASLEKGYKTTAATEGNSFHVETKADDALHNNRLIRDKMYAADASQLRFRYHPACTRYLVWAAAAAASLTSTAFAYHGYSLFELTFPSVLGYIAESSLEVGVASTLARRAIKSLVPLVINGKSLLMDIERERVRGETLHTAIKGLDETLSHDKTLKLAKVKKLIRRKAKLQKEQNDRIVRQGAMTKLLPDIYLITCAGDGLHVTYSAPADKKFEDVRAIMTGLVPTK
ncbi:hypothetical protein HY490_01060 [Candidatus Woesearchaeota archaeon]|nr:hypothetical protein [Candidatus Woesearchaeota archaeon]